eukprot:495852-Rhodomonas_salina.1
MRVRPEPYLSRLSLYSWSWSFQVPGPLGSSVSGRGCVCEFRGRRRWITWLSRDLVALRSRFGLPHSRPRGHVTVPSAH